MLLIINGASGAGKTTIAATLIGRIDGAAWVHPDELWDTPNMDSESILKRAATHALDQGHVRMTIIDCQIRPTSIARVLTHIGSNHWMNVVVTCPRAVREARLVQRGWASTNFDTIDNWARILEAEAIAAGDLVVDTSLHSTEHVCAQIQRRLSEHTDVGA